MQAVAFFFDVQRLSLVCLPPKVDQMGKCLRTPVKQNNLYREYDFLQSSAIYLFCIHRQTPKSHIKRFTQVINK